MVQEAAGGAGQAMRALSGAWAASAGLGLGIHLATFVLVEELRSRALGMDPAQVLRLLEILSRAPGWVDLAIAIASAILALLLARGLSGRSARALAALAATVALASAGASLLELSLGAPPLPRPDELPSRALTRSRALWVAEAALERDAPALALGAALVALPALPALPASWPARAWAGLAVYVAASLAHVALVSSRAESYGGPAGSWLASAARGAEALAALAAALTGRALARRLEAGEPRSSRGAPLRILGAAGTARVLSGLLGGALALLAARRGDQAALRGDLTLSVLFGAASGLVAVAALLFLRARVLARALALVLRARVLAASAIALSLSIALDLFATSAAVELAELAERAARASPLFGGPDLSRLGALQASATWGSRLSLALGAAAAWLTVAELGRASRALDGSAEAAALASRLGLLVVALSSGALGLGVLTDALHARRLALLGECVLAGVALGALYGWLRLTLGLAPRLAARLDPAPAPPEARRRGAGMGTGRSAPIAPRRPSRGWHAGGGS